MQLIINGETYPDINDGISVADLLDYLSLPCLKVAVECNKEIVSKSTYQTHCLSDGDRLEIIHFIGGG